MALYLGSEKVQFVLNKGYDEGVADGKQTQYDAFWDAYQDSGTRTNYSRGFAGLGWNDETFKPKYDIRPTAVDQIFSASGITDIAKALKDCGVVFDMSNAPINEYVVHSNSIVTALPVMDCRGSTDVTFFIDFCDNLRSIEKVIFKDDGTQTFGAYTLGWLWKLEEIRFEGCIGKDFMIQQSPLLSDASVQSIIDCLKDLTGETAQTLTLHADVVGRMTDEQKATITAKNWTLVY